MVAVYTQRNERVTHIIPLMKKGKLNILSVQLIVNEDDMCGSCMRLYTVDWSVNGIVSFISLLLCVQSVIKWMKKIVQAYENDSKINGLKMFAYLFSWYCSLKQCPHSFFLSSDKHRHVWLGCLIWIFFSGWFVHKHLHNRCLI